MSRRRYHFRLDSNDPEQRELSEWLESTPEGLRNKIIIRTLVKGISSEQVEQCLRKIIREEMGNVQLAPLEDKRQENVQKEDVPGEMMDFLDSLLDQ